jgi:hypothetical protein
MSSLRLSRQFRLSSLLWLMVVIGVGLAAYRWGFQTGLVEGVRHRRWVGTTYAKAYDVSDLVEIKPNESDLRYAEDLCRDLTKKVLPRTWQEEGGAAAISGYQTNRMIVISHDQDGHDRIAEYLDKLRNSNK